MRTTSAPVSAAWVALVAVTALCFAIRARLADVPLDRDEGEFAYIAQQMLRGVPPYESGYAMKLPGIYLVYAANMLVFGQSIVGVHLGGAAANALAMLLVFLIGREILDEAGGGVAAACFGLLSLDPAFHGSAAQAEQFVLVPTLLATWMLMRGKAPLVAGLLLGCAILIKQHAVMFAVAAVIATLAARDYRRTARLAIGVCVPWLVCVAAMAWLGVFDKFWEWTASRAATYAVALESVAGHVAAQIKQLALVAPLVWALAALGLATLLLGDRRRLVLLMLVACGAAVLPGLNFFGHYYIYTLPLAGLAFAAGALFCARALKIEPVGLVAAMIAGAALVATSVPKWPYCFSLPAAEVARLVYGPNPFPEAVRVADYINEHGGGTLAVIGSEPEIYFYTGARAATGHIYMYPLMEPTAEGLALQQEMAGEIERRNPDWLVEVVAPSSWAAQERSSHWISDWFGRYKRSYEPVGAVVVTSDGMEEMWGELAKNYQPLTNIYLRVYRRMEDRVGA